MHGRVCRLHWVQATMLNRCAGEMCCSSLPLMPELLEAHQFVRVNHQIMPAMVFKNTIEHNHCRVSIIRAVLLFENCHEAGCDCAFYDQTSNLWQLSTLVVKDTAVQQGHLPHREELEQLQSDICSTEDLRRPVNLAQKLLSSPGMNKEVSSAMTELLQASSCAAKSLCPV